MYQVSEVFPGAGEVKGPDEAAVGQVKEEDSGAGDAEGEPPVVLLLLGATLLKEWRDYLTLFHPI